VIVVCARRSVRSRSTYISYTSAKLGMRASLSRAGSRFRISSLKRSSCATASNTFSPSRSGEGPEEDRLLGRQRLRVGREGLAIHPGDPPLGCVQRLTSP
jgi:hypothetical protein